MESLLCSAPVLMAPQLTKPFKLFVDASKVGAGAVLMQADADGVNCPVSFFSKKFNSHELNYSIVEKEALVLILALKHFEVYVGSGDHPLVVYTDHNPLTFLHSLQNPNQRLMRLCLFLQPFHLQIHHVKGVDDIMADALSQAILVE